MALLDDDSIADALQSSPWERQGDVLVREVAFDDFKGALAFVNRVGEAAEEANHHPDVLLHSYKDVRLTLCTHSEGGITQADLDLASGIDGLVG
jgi:4a-hydroxytetrahydrobiopterin dehydratase